MQPDLGDVVLFVVFTIMVALAWLVRALTMDWGDWQPDAFVWPVVYWALFTGPGSGRLRVLGMGLARDLASATVPGTHALLSWIAYRFARPSKESYRRFSLLGQVIVTGVAATIVTGLLGIALIAAGGKLPWERLFMRSICLGISTGLLAPIAFLSFALLTKLARTAGGSRQ